MRGHRLVADVSQHFGGSLLLNNGLQRLALAVVFVGVFFELVNMLPFLGGLVDLDVLFVCVLASLEVLSRFYVHHLVLLGCRAHLLS